MDQVTYQIINHSTPTAASVQLTISSCNPSAFHQTKLTVKTTASAVGVSGPITKSSNSATITVDTGDYNALLNALSNFPCPPGPMPLTLSGEDNSDGTILNVNSWTLPQLLLAKISRTLDNIGLDAANISRHAVTIDIHAATISGRLEINGEILAELRSINQRLENVEDLVRRQLQHQRHDSSMLPTEDLPTGSDRF